MFGWIGVANNKKIKTKEREKGLGEVEKGRKKH
jgi:hypothetical protein